MTLRLGISTCPNDTFAFHGLLTGRVRPEGLDLSIELGDVQELNERLTAGTLDAAKVSYHAALLNADRWSMLPVGSALGFGVGPLLVAAEGRTTPDAPRPGSDQPARVLCPGAGTTADLLYGLFHPGQGHVEQVVFSEILPRLQRGDADFGVCIHEGRFTFADLGLRRVEDLGTTWEESTGLPLPLGGIAVRKELGAARHTALTHAVRRSLAYAHAHRDETLESMRPHAQELDDDVLWAHVELYVNGWTSELGDQGRAAIAELGRRARANGRISQSAAELEVLKVPETT